MEENIPQKTKTYRKILLRRRKNTDAHDISIICNIYSKHFDTPNKDEWKARDIQREGMYWRENAVAVIRLVKHSTRTQIQYTHTYISTDKIKRKIEVCFIKYNWNWRVFGTFPSDVFQSYLNALQISCAILFIYLYLLWAKTKPSTWKSCLGFVDIVAFWVTKKLLAYFFFLLFLSFYSNVVTNVM